MVNLAEKRAVPQFNTFKSDVFSIGMVLLYCTSLTDPIVAYNLDKLEIDFYYLENLMRIAAKHYSRALVRTLRTMLSEKSRPTARELLDQLQGQMQGPS